MPDSLYRIEYCLQCGDNFVMWYVAWRCVHVIGCWRCQTVAGHIYDIDLANMPDDYPQVRRYRWMVEHNRMVEAPAETGIDSTGHPFGHSYP